MVVSLPVFVLLSERCRGSGCWFLRRPLLSGLEDDYEMCQGLAHCVWAPGRVWFQLARCSLDVGYVKRPRSLRSKKKYRCRVSLTYLYSSLLFLANQPTDRPMSQHRDARRSKEHDVDCHLSTWGSWRETERERERVREHKGLVQTKVGQGKPQELGENSSC